MSTAPWKAGTNDLGDREHLGRVVRETWVKWAREQPNPKPSWLVEWEHLGEPDKEVDRRIGEAIADELFLAWKAGRDAYKDGTDVDDNPHGDVLGMFWSNGWLFECSYQRAGQ